MRRSEAHREPDVASAPVPTVVTSVTRRPTASAMVVIAEVGDGARCRPRAASARRRRPPRRPGPPAGTPPRAAGRPRGTRAAGRARTARPAPPRGRGCAAGRVSARSSRTRLPVGQVAQPHHRAQRLVRQRLVVLVAHGELRVVDRARCRCRPASRRTRARSRWVSPRAARELTQRLVPSAAALRPSSVVANFQVTNGRPCSTANVQARFRSRASSSQQPARDVDAGRAQGRGSPPAATGLRVGLGEDDAGDAGVEQRLRAGSGAAGVVARLEGDHRGGTPGVGRRRSRAPRPRRAGCRRRGGSPRRPRSRRGVEQHAADPRVGAERHARACAASSRARRIARCSRRR